MTNGIPDRLSQLRARWQADPTSRVFLQLSEEYRHLGRMREALDVLEAGLKEHPGYLSALVAKGRCLLELGEAKPAATVLERVVQQDATQMVANKLLVRAYIETGQAEQARHRLDLYTLLSERDPEIEELAKRVAAMGHPPEAADEPRQAEAAERPPMASPAGDPPEANREVLTRPLRRAPGGDVFDLEPVQTTRPALADVFHLEPPPPSVRPEPAPPAPAAAAAVAQPFARLPVPAMPEPAAVAAPAESNGHDAHEPFPGLGGPEWQARYLASLAAEGIFFRERGLRVAPAALAVQTDAPAPAAPPLHQPIAAPSLPVVATPVAPARAAGTSTALPTLELPAAAAPSPILDAPAAPAAPVRPAVVAPPPAPEPIAELEPEREEHATATLGFLYLNQGHVEEAQRIFGEVLRREPHNGAVRAALSGLEKREPPLDAANLLEGFAAGPATTANAKKTFLLNSYLRRLKPGSPHVS